MPLSKSGPRGESSLFLQSVARALSVLEAFGSNPRPLSLAELAAATGLDKSAAQRIAHTLQQLGYLERDAARDGLVPGRRLLDRGFDYLRMNPLIERATPILFELRRNTGERVDLSLFDGTTSVYALRLQSKRETFFATLHGRRLPIFCSSGGRAMLAALPVDEARAILEACDRRPVTQRTLTDIDLLQEAIAQAREDGYALVLEQTLLGEIALSAAVCDNQGRPVAAIHVAGSLSEWREPDFRQRIAPLAIEAARALSG